MSIRLNNIFSETDCLSSEILIAYSENKLAADEKYLVEKHLLDCELCADAVEGISSLKDKSKLKPAIEEISKKIDNYAQAKRTKVIHFDFRMRMAVAAVLVVIVGITFLFRDILLKQNKDMVAQRTVKESKLENKDQEAFVNSEENINSMTEAPAGMDDGSKMKDANSEKTANMKGLAESDKENIPYLPKQNSGSATDQNIQQTFTGYFNSTTIDATTTWDDSEGYNEILLSKDLDLKVAEDKKEIVAEESQIQSDMAVVTESKTSTTKSSDNKIRNSQKNLKKDSYKQDVSEAPVLAGSGVAVADELTDNRFEDGVALYQNSDYSACVNQMELYLEDVPNDNNANYYCGASKYFLGQYDSAITYLSKVLNDKNNNFYETAQWYLSLSYIGLNNSTEASKTLKDIVKSKGSFKSQAEEKLLEIENK